MAYRITIVKESDITIGEGDSLIYLEDNRIYLENTYATIAEANKASFSRRILEALDVLEYDYVTITEVEEPQ